MSEVSADSDADEAVQSSASSSSGVCDVCAAVLDDLVSQLSTDDGFELVEAAEVAAAAEPRASPFSRLILDADGELIFVAPAAPTALVAEVATPPPATVDEGALVLAEVPASAAAYPIDFARGFVAAQRDAVLARASDEAGVLGRYQWEGLGFHSSAALCLEEAGVFASEVPP